MPFNSSMNSMEVSWNPRRGKFGRGGEGEKNKVEDMKALSEPLTSLIKKVLADKVEMRR